MPIHASDEHPQNDPARAKLNTMQSGSGCGFAVISIIGLGLLAAMTAGFLGSNSNGLLWLALAMPVLLLMFGFGLLLPRLLRVRRAKRELDQGEAQQTTGQVTWTGKRYQLNAGDLKLDPLDGVEWMPGQYQFTYLPQSRYVTHGVRIDTNIADAQTQVRDALGTVFKFDADDLAACRQGQLSEAHRTRQVRSAMNAILFMAIFGGIFLLAGLGVLFGGRVQPGSVIGAAIAMLVGGFLVYSGIGQLRAARAGQVSAIEGVVTESVTRSRNSTSYYFVLHGQRYSVTQAAQNALVQGQKYRVFVLTNTSTIVAIEPIGT